MTLLLTTVLLLTPVPDRGTATWPEFRGPTRDGRSTAQGLPLTWSEKKHVTWKTPIFGRAWSTPVVWGDQVWVTTAPKTGRELYAMCVDVRTGHILRTIKVFDVADPPPVIAINTYASPSPAIEQGRVYVHFGSMGTACLDAATGRVVWQRRDLLCDHLRGPGSSLVLHEETLIVTLDGTDVQYLVALDTKTGTTVWKSVRSTEFGNADGDLRKAYSTPIIIECQGRRQLISSGAKATMAYDPSTGRELWKILYGGFSNASRPVAADGLVFVNTGFSRAQLWAVRPDGRGDVTDSHVLWKFTGRAPNKASPVVVDGLIYMPSDSNSAFCLDAKTGATVWQESIGGQYWASPIHAQGRVYFFNSKGVTTVVRAGRTFEVLAVNTLDEGFMASAAIVDKAFILRTKTHLYRIEN